MDDIVKRLGRQRFAEEVGEPCANWLEAQEAAAEIEALRQCAKVLQDFIRADPVRLAAFQAWVAG